jgi:hypothetical protein
LTVIGRLYSHSAAKQFFIDINPTVNVGASISFETQLALTAMKSSFFLPTQTTSRSTAHGMFKIS